MIKKFTCLIFVLIFWGQTGSGQEMMHLQSVVKQEYINPAYNSFKDYISLNVISRLQWVNLPYHPEVYGANLYIPVNGKRLGFNTTLMRENIGLRKIISMDVSLASSVQLSETGTLAFGYGLGIKSTNYRTEDIISNYDEYLFDHEVWNSQKVTSKLGLLYAGSQFYTGISANLVIDKDWEDRYVLWPSIDFIAGGTFRISDHVVFRPDIVIKYYKAETADVYNQKVNSSYLDPVVDPGISFQLFSRLWLGTSYRFKMAQTFSLTVEAAKDLQLGYTYEYGIGEGVNQFSTHGLNLSYRFGQRSQYAQKSSRARQSLAQITSKNYLYH